MEITKNAVLDWKNKLIDTTGEQIGWNFQYRQFSVAEQQELFFDNLCTVNIYFERTPPKGEWEYLGYADSYLTLSDITIFYLEPTYNTVEPFEVTGFKNILTFGLHDTIRHEMGHSLGLDHPKFEEKHYVKESSNLYLSPSIMTDDYDLELDGNISYKITDYDIRSVINLYGEDGIDEINFMVYIDFVIIGIVLIIIIYFVNRERKKPDLISIDD